MGQGRPIGPKGHQLAWAPLWDTRSIGTSLGHHVVLAFLWDTTQYRHLFKRFSFHRLVAAIFLIIIQIALSSYQLLPLHVAYLFSVILYQYLKRILLHFILGTSTPCSPNQKAGGALSPLCPPIWRPRQRTLINILTSLPPVAPAQ